VTIAHGSHPNYEPNTLEGPVENKKYAWAKEPVSGTTGRFAYQHPNTPFEQPRTLWNKVFSETDREHLIKNLSGPLSAAKRPI
jgi:catalase